jgi:hypothetical protein
VGNEERTAKIDRLRQQVSEATGRKADLVSEAHDVAAKIGEVRDRLGNPFFYSGGTADDLRMPTSPSRILLVTGATSRVCDCSKPSRTPTAS